MSHYSSLGEAATVAAEAENVEEITVSVEFEHAFGENPATSDGERYAVRLNAMDDLGEGASDNLKLWTCYLGSSAIMVGKIKEMEGRGYFPEGKGHAPRAETVLKPNGDEDVIYEDFFIVSPCMPPHPTMANILLHFQAQLL
jgi:hypothetical protein